MHPKHPPRHLVDDSACRNIWAPTYGALLAVAASGVLAGGLATGGSDGGGRAVEDRAPGDRRNLERAVQRTQPPSRRVAAGCGCIERLRTACFKFKKTV